MTKLEWQLKFIRENSHYGIGKENNMIICNVKTCKHRTAGKKCGLERTKMDSDGYCSSYEHGKAICACYHYDNIHHCGCCWGTKNMEICYCDGNINRCDFYEKGVEQ